jgi:ABC-2 type transport system ATP-binding protein
MTLVVSSHILAELDEYSTHMLVLRGGRVVEHREIRAAAPGQSRRLRVSLAAPDPRLAAVLEGAGASHVAMEAAGAQFEWTGDAAGQALLLRALVEAGLPVASFEPVRENLHDSYLETVAPSGRTQ